MIAITTSSSTSVKAEQVRRRVALFMTGIKRSFHLDLFVPRKLRRCLDLAGILTPGKSVPPSRCSYWTCNNGFKIGTISHRLQRRGRSRFSLDSL